MHSAASTDRTRRIAYLMSRFPKITETFILYEMLALERLGHRVEVFPLLRQPGGVTHAEAQPFVERAHYRAHLSLPILAAHLHYLLRRPRAYLGAVWEVLSGTWRSPNFFFGGLASFPKAVRFAYDIERLGVDHVHAHFANHPTLAALVIHRLTGVPFSFTVHAFDLFVDQTMLAKKVEAAACVVTISDFNRRTLLEVCGQDATSKIHVVHCGIDPAVFVPSKDPRGDQRFSILCVGALEELKGHAVLIDACAALRDRGVDFICRCAGSGSLEQSLRKRISDLGLQNHVILEGAKPRAEVVRLLATADVVVLPSVPTAGGKREGIPVALMEAMAAGRPVIASAMTGLAELVEQGRTGFLLQPRDGAALTSTLEMLSQDPDLRDRLGQAGREKVEREFNLNASAEQLAQLFGGVSCAPTARHASQPSSSPAF